MRADVLGGATHSGEQFCVSNKPTRSVEFQKSLQNPAFKKQLTDALAERLLQIGEKLDADQKLVVDSPGYDTPMCVTNMGSPSAMPDIAHRLGEADYAIWHHIRHCSEGSIVVVAGDTDIFMYGMALQSVGLLGDMVEQGGLKEWRKCIVMERQRDADYLQVTRSMQALEHLHQPQVIR